MNDTNTVTQVFLCKYNTCTLNWSWALLACFNGTCKMNGQSPSSLPVDLPMLLETIFIFRSRTANMTFCIRTHYNPQLGASCEGH